MPAEVWRRASRCQDMSCVEVAFVKAARSETMNCVEVAACPHGVRVRDSKHPDGPVLTFTPPEWAAFVAGAKAGEFDV